MPASLPPGIGDASRRGLAGTRNSINVAIQNFADFCVFSAIFWALGLALMFGATASGIVGTAGFMPGSTGLTVATRIFGMIVMAIAIDMASIGIGLLFPQLAG